MARRLTIITQCPICGEQVEQVSDGMLRSQPHYHNAEYVVTHLGFKKYIHSTCWNEMIEEQKKNREVVES